MPYLLQAAFWVGVIGTVAGAPLLCLLRMEHSYLSEPLFIWSAPLVLFFSAALTFSASHELLPSSRWRTQVAGMIAGVVTFFGFALWTTFMAKVGLGPYDRSLSCSCSSAGYRSAAGGLQGGSYRCCRAQRRNPHEPHTVSQSERAHSNGDVERRADHRYRPPPH
jgi:hypothetical protein